MTSTATTAKGSTMTTAPASGMTSANHPAAWGEPVQERHARACRETGHVAWTRDGVDVGRCARCGEVTIPANLPAYRTNADGSAVCQHRDLSVCPDCLAADDRLVDVLGSAFLIVDPTDRAALRASLA